MRGDVYMADFNPRSGAELTGWHPLIVVSTDGMNLARGWRSIIVVPISSSARPRPPLSVELPQGTAGLTRDCRALCYQLTTLDVGKLGQRLGTLSPELMAQIEAAIAASLDLP